MSDTPRTDEAEIRCVDEPEQPLGMVEVDFARQLERELNAAKERIRRLEEAGNALDISVACGCGIDGPCKRCSKALDGWHQTKEDKP